MVGDTFRTCDRGGTKRGPGCPQEWGIPASPSYDDIGGWSRRMVAGDTSNVGIEKDAQVTVQLGGKPMTFTIF
jgi:hypothetical protein